uniref:Uncharacterized protein n=1 Tax=Lepeophtheirus salmonis TaxID=72036 RepID=A0A0K2VFT5_LEPSM
MAAHARKKSFRRRTVARTIKDNLGLNKVNRYTRLDHHVIGLARIFNLMYRTDCWAREGDFDVIENTGCVGKICESAPY